MPSRVDPLSPTQPLHVTSFGEMQRSFERRAPAHPTAAAQPSAPGHAAVAATGQREGKSPVWIDSVTKRHLKESAQEATLYAATALNNPSVGLYHVQTHARSRIPRVIAIGRSIGDATVTSYNGLRKDTQLGLETAEQIASIRSFKNISESLLSDIARLREENVSWLPTQEEALAATKRVEKKRGFFS